jgi:hypothetical protein
MNAKVGAVHSQALGLGKRARQRSARMMKAGWVKTRPCDYVFLKKEV